MAKLFECFEKPLMDKEKQIEQDWKEDAIARNKKWKEDIIAMNKKWKEDQKYRRKLLKIVEMELSCMRHEMKMAGIPLWNTLPWIRKHC